MRRCALVWLLASALAAVGTPDASARHKHVSQHRKKAVEVEQHKHRIDSAVESTTPLPPDVAAAKQAIELVRRHKSNDATMLAASSGDPVVKKLVEWALLRRFDTAKLVSTATLTSSATIPIGRVSRSYAGARR
jgi:soluble lytic murein transglycosylase